VVHHTCGDEEGKYISFKLQIKDFHSDGEGKYISFKLSSHFISTGMTMLSLTTVVYLINRLHSSALNSESPYFTLHETLPYYSSPQVFGSKSFPYTSDTRQHKFYQKTVLYIFVGYNDKQKRIQMFSCFQQNQMLFLSMWSLMNHSFPIKKIIIATPRLLHHYLLLTYLIHSCFILTLIPLQEYIPQQSLHHA
jgi:hypothetical protein